MIIPFALKQAGAPKEIPTIWYWFKAFVFAVTIAIWLATHDHPLAAVISVLIMIFI